jgi:starch synthase
VSACLYYHPEAYTTSGPRLMGRHAAGESFLRGFLQHSQADMFWVQVQRQEHAQHFAQTAQALARREAVKAVDKTSLGALAQAGVVYHPGPGIGPHAFQRASFGHTAWSLCGITHTTSSAGAMDALSELICAPVQPWDAVICTSTAVKSQVTRLLQAQVDYLQERLGVTKLVLPQLPVIPLGIHTQDFAFSAEHKAAARVALGVDEHTLVVLFMGRLSFHAKAHPLAMYQALEAAALATGKSVVLVECGWHANEFIAKAYAEAACSACPHVRVITLDGRKADERHTAWAGADMFCSLSDNIQETFGIVPIEAMAAGLPVVVSDWDGYKDTVREGIDGFRIPTLMPQAGLGKDLAQRHALEIDTYDMYCGHTCALVAVDVAQATHAFVRLFESPQLRARMGAAGRQRAREEYDWKAIIRQYEALWATQTELRLAAQHNPANTLAHPWPARMDPFHSFASYPSALLTPDTLLALATADTAVAAQRVAHYRKLAMVKYAAAVLPTDAEVQQVLNATSGGMRPAIELLQAIDPARRAPVFRALVWLVKLGVLRMDRQPDSALFSRSDPLHQPPSVPVANGSI